MPRIVGDDIFEGRKPSHGSGEKYPYDDWLDGKSRVFVRGEDFDGDIPPKSFAYAVRRGMRKRGFKIQAKVLNRDEVAIRAYRET